MKVIRGAADMLRDMPVPEYTWFRLMITRKPFSVYGTVNPGGLVEAVETQHPTDYALWVWRSLRDYDQSLYTVVGEFYMY